MTSLRSIGSDGWGTAQAERLHARRGRGLGEPVDIDVSAARVGG